MKTWEVELVPVPNNVRERWGSQWYHRARDAKRWRQHLTVICGRPRSPVLARVRLRIMVTRGSVQDPGNDVASVKPVVDALVWLGWLVDDSHKWLELNVVEIAKRSRDLRGTVIEYEVL